MRWGNHLPVQALYNNPDIGDVSRLRFTKFREVLNAPYLIVWWKERSVPQHLRMGKISNTLYTLEGKKIVSCWGTYLDTSCGIVQNKVIFQTWNAAIYFTSTNTKTLLSFASLSSPPFLLPTASNSQIWAKLKSVRKGIIRFISKLLWHF